MAQIDVIILDFTSTDAGLIADFVAEAVGGGVGAEEDVASRGAHLGGDERSVCGGVVESCQNAGQCLFRAPAVFEKVWFRTLHCEMVRNRCAGTWYQWNSRHLRKWHCSFLINLRCAQVSTVWDQN